MAGAPDDTVILRPGQPRRRQWFIAAAGAVLVVAGLAAGGWWLLERQPAAPAAPPSVAQAYDPIEPASEAAIRAESPAARTVLRFAMNPAVVVIDFPTLAEQGRMFNRLAAWEEKAGVSHDQVPDEPIMAAAIAASGATADTYYYGHDYSGAAVKQFFALAAEEHKALRPEEEDLRRIAARAMAEPAGFGAVVTVVRADAANGVSPQARATILHHELSHGEYFTKPAYAAFVKSFWENTLTSDERAAFRSYLAAEGYDPALEDLMRNETQAYLMHTPDPVFFEPGRLAILPGRLAQIRAAFLAGMPAGWLRDAVVASGIVPPEPAK
ncbi:MAG: hypothetical protein RQ966_05450 [Acetobacteraceae bacterium]|nr:hypothetical protein [Acetobacteraceae bacterium]